jgi:hypothetical protein
MSDSFEEILLKVPVHDGKGDIVSALIDLLNLLSDRYGTAIMLSVWDYVYLHAVTTRFESYNSPEAISIYMHAIADAAEDHMRKKGGFPKPKNDAPEIFSGSTDSTLH